MPGSGFIEACSSAASLLAPTSTTVLHKLTIPVPLVIASQTATLLETVIDSHSGAVEIAAFGGGGKNVHCRCQVGIMGKSQSH